MSEDRMRKWFDYAHLSGDAQDVSKHFAGLQAWIESNIPGGPERTVAMRKLLEAKDCAVRAVTHPGG